MKYIKLYLIAVLLTGGTACTSLLDKQPLDQLTEDSFYKTERDADNALLSCYAPLQDVEWNGKGWMITEIPSDNTQPGGTDPEFTPIDDFTVTADNVAVANYWAVRYRGITYANAVIGKLAGMTIDANRKNEFLAEAQFLRAVAYFDLVRVYGGVPVITEVPAFGEDLFFERASEREVYELIKTDLSFAARHLPLERTGAGVGRATKGAALAYLAKVHLTRREYVDARDRAKEVMETGVYELMDNYQDNFELSTSDNNRESIFQIQFAGCGPFGTGNPLQAFFAPWGEGITKDRDGWGSQIPTSPLVSSPNTTILDAFTEGDLRRDPSIMTPNTFYPSVNAEDGGYTYPKRGASATTINIKKYVVGSGPNICFMSTPQNAHLMRFADVLLIYAEAITVIKGGVTSDADALNAFNRVHTRAGLDPLDQIDMDIILQERRVELAFEGHRWFDLIRTGRAMETLLLHGKKFQQHHVLFPIPAGELEVNPKLVQNQGY
ncbi:MAG: RagB/SusD family nutrient uptake outer membrane protein [Bacteroidota bacterium]